jgi:uncharacterized protein (DUF1015 family)
MPTIQPFAGYRYAKKTGPIKDLVAPPYDVIDEHQRMELAARNPYNIVRIILPEDKNGSTDTEERYADTAERFKKWCADGMLKKDDAPAYYLYSQTFKINGKTHHRTGFMGACLLEKFGEGSIYPHERTLAGPKIDRLKLTRATKTQLSQIFGLYPDPKKESVKFMAKIMKSREPDMDLPWEDGRERVWIITDSAEQKILTDAVQKSDGIYIADGHHRYETAYGYSQEVRQRHETAAPPGALPADYVLMVFVPMEDPGLVVLPTHRVVYGVKKEKADHLLAGAVRQFDIIESGDDDILDLSLTTKGLPKFGLAGRGSRRYILSLKDKRSMDHRAPDRSVDWRILDVSVLHLLILEDLLGIDAGKLERKENITYVKSAEQAVKMVESGDKKNQWAFIMRPTRIDQLKAVADHGEVMPQKSTYFYPKLLAGLVIRPLA